MKRNGKYAFYEYKDFHASFNRNAGTAHISDKLAEQMRQDDLISPETFDVYMKQAELLFTPPERMDELTKDQIDVQIQQVRRLYLGIEALEKERVLKWKRGCTFDTNGGIDQQEKKQSLLESADTVILMLCQAELLSMMMQDLETIRENGKKVCIIVSAAPGWDVADRETLQKELKDLTAWDYYEIMESTTEELQRILFDPFPENIPTNCRPAHLSERMQQGRLLLVYGEDGFLLCRNLPVESIIHGIPKGYCTRALTNQFGKDSACVVYVPPFFDVTSWVPLIERTRLSFWQLYRLWEKYGDVIYQYSPVQLYRKYPQQFFNVYDTGVLCVEDETGYPIRLSWSDVDENIPASKYGSVDSLPAEVIFGLYDRLRDQAISRYLNSQRNLKYYSSYFNENMEEEAIPWNCTCDRNGIMVQGVRISRVKDAGIVTCGDGVSPRQVLHGDSLQLVSNFLFFFTPALAGIYNELRIDRPREQIALTKMHLDYMLYQKDGERIETFPLFEKACIAKKRNGQFMFFNYRLGGGKIQVNDTIVEWKDADINVPGGMVYTPDYSRKDEGAQEQTYRKLVGKDRFNLVIIQNRIHCIRKGDVVLPSIGVVVSLDQDLEKRILHECKLLPLGDGYYDCSNLNLKIELDRPSQISCEEWQQVEWAYGGGMSLILDDQGIDSTPREASEEWFRKEGWMCPLSRQTQESALHNLDKHPRTAIGITWENELVILIFSGRIRLSSGADYYEMCGIARKLIPEIRCLMNVDGGGSSMLGMVLNGSFVELSCPATSGSSCVGMVRPINTVLCLDT